MKALANFAGVTCSVPVEALWAAEVLRAARALSAAQALLQPEVPLPRSESRPARSQTPAPLRAESLDVRFAHTPDLRGKQAELSRRRSFAAPLPSSTGSPCSMRTLQASRANRSCRTQCRSPEFPCNLPSPCQLPSESDRFPRSTREIPARLGSSLPLAPLLLCPDTPGIPLFVSRQLAPSAFAPILESWARIRQCPQPAFAPLRLSKRAPRSSTRLAIDQTGPANGKQTSRGRK